MNVQGLTTVGTTRSPFVDNKGAIRAHWSNEPLIREAVRQWIYSRCPGSTEKRDHLFWEAGALYDNGIRNDQSAEWFIEALEAKMDEVIGFR